MKWKRTGAVVFLVMVTLSFTLPVGAQTPETGEEALFTNSNSPDALILLDLSGSMNWNPAGGSAIYGNTSCSGTFYSSSRSGYTTNCRRLAIAKRALFDLLDDNGDGTINSADEGSLNVRIGYMRFYDCEADDTGGSYTSGCIQIPGSSSSRRYIGSKYSQLYCGSNSSCALSDTGSYSIGGQAQTAVLLSLQPSTRQSSTLMLTRRLTPPATAATSSWSSSPMAPIHTPVVEMAQNVRRICINAGGRWSLGPRP